ncbi:hypothetical protein A9P44_20235 [Paenibacillus polymyxa]|nr:TnsD family Tn7-like transposition protein [Paenibacillus polymyxa]OBA03949.1 hypothetical protein A9P44_20235 [Paenibacillus polymyxa]
MIINLYPDEYIYSICARFHFYLGTQLRSASRLIQSYSTLLDMCHLMRPVTPSKSLVDAAYLLQTHTLHPYFNHFIPNHKKKEIKNTIMNDLLTNLENRMGFKITNPDLCLCPLCFIEDMHNYGDPYWHRSHQLAGTLVCDTHNIMLLSECPVCGEVLATSTEKIPKVPSLFCSSGHSLECVIPNHNKILLTIACENRLLLDEKVNLDVIEIEEKMKGILLYKEHISNKHTSRNIKVNQKFQAKFSEEYVNRIEDSIQNLKINSIWKKQSIHPIFYVLYMIYFSGTITNFIHEDKYLPWKNMKSWPCPNKVCPNYKQLVVQLVNSEMISGDIYGYFMCPTCGYAYSECDGDNLGTLDIISKGHLWETKFKELLYREDISFDDMKEILGTTFYWIEKELKKYEDLGLELLLKKLYSKEILENIKTDAHINKK